MSHFFQGNPGPTFYQKSQSNADCCSCNDCNGPCYCYSVIAQPDSTITYLNCKGEEVIIDVTYPIQYSFCAKPDSVSVSNDIIPNPIISYLNNGPCENINCSSLQNNACYCFTIVTESTGDIVYTNCSGVEVTVPVSTSIPSTFKFCMTGDGPTFTGTATITFNGVCGAPNSPCNR